MVVHTRVHVLVGFANPFLVCSECKAKVPYWHNPDRCGCDEEDFYNSPCKHVAEVISICPTWDPVEGCSCTNKETHDK